MLCLSFCFLVLAGLFLLNVKSAYRGLMISTFVMSVDKANLDKNQTVDDFFEKYISKQIYFFISGNKTRENQKFQQKEKLQILSAISSFYKDKKINQFAKCNDNICTVSVRSSEMFDKYYKEVFLYKNKNYKAENQTYNTIAVILQSSTQIKLRINTWFFTKSDSRYAEISGILASLKGTLYIIAIFFVFCVPLSIITALYLEEFASKNWITNLIDLNINNLSAVPSIIYGLLGLLVYTNYFHLPRSSPIVGGLTLSLLVMPILISSSRNSIRSIPQMLREITFAMGASKSRVVFGVVLPTALPGIFTGIILTLARLIGETAPLLIIGMFAFVGEVPQSITSPSTVIPVQVYLWLSSPNYLLVNKASLLILCLIIFLFIVNYIINFIRQKFQIRQQN
jgi:phosphate ABC transporter permease subunit PstA